ncbi:MAG: histidine kinase [Acidobacteriota bacterium]|nr:histidine kinase [Acidobacteriota bacterium]
MAIENKPEWHAAVLAPFGKDAQLIGEVLKGSAVIVEPVTAADALVHCVQRGVDVAILTEEALDDETISSLNSCIADQPAWSDLPVIILTGGGASTPLTEMAVRSRAALGNVTLLERPVRPATLLSIVRTALRARSRQYEIREHLDELRRSHAAQKEINDHLESLVEQRTVALRRLSAQLMRAQDDERRRMARELHDGLGQYLAAAQINLTLYSDSNGNDSSNFLTEARRLVTESVSGIRTLSYLLHPPLLDEAGFFSAAQWYVEGFAKRSGINVELQMPKEPERMPDAVELALFRVLQEALINVHRHSGSSRVDVHLQRVENENIAEVIMELKDYGKGMSQSLLDRFQAAGTGDGVGLAGMRERVKELGGELRLESSGSGTVLKVTVPLSGRSVLKQKKIVERL